MQVSDFDEPPNEDPSPVPDKAEETKSDDDDHNNNNNNNNSNSNSNNNVVVDDESILDISGKSLDFSLSENAEKEIQGLYVYRNVFNLIPRSLGGAAGRLKTLKFFANEINLFPEEFGNLVELECLQLKVSSPCLGNVPLQKLKDLKELELCKVPPRPAAFKLLSDIAGLKCLTKLSVCHFSIRYLPPEIGCLNNLEYLDLSFNKMKSLPYEISYLNALITLKVTNNKLVDLPSNLSSLQRLENLDFSHNRLMSLGSLKLGSMHSLQNLNLQYNKHLSCCQIPSWICCNLEGSGELAVNEDVNCSVEMDVLDSAMKENRRSFSCKSSPNISVGLSIGSSSSSRSYAASRLGKRWKRQFYLQQRARQERLNSSRKWRIGNHSHVTTKSAEGCNESKVAVIASESLTGVESAIVGLGHDNEELLCGESECNNALVNFEDGKTTSRKECHEEDCSSLDDDSILISREDEHECCEDDALSTVSNKAAKLDEVSSSKVSQSMVKAKRHSDKDLDNPKPCKSRRPTDDHSNLSRKYSTISFCSFEDTLPDGFYDAGRDRPFMSLTSYEQNLHPESREVILVDRERDEELDAIALSAQAMVLNLKKFTTSTEVGEKAAVDNLQIASLLALFVSDHFGGSDRSNAVERTRKAVSGSNYRKPFVCTCTTGNSESSTASAKTILGTAEDIVFNDLSERSLRSIKLRRNSVIVPIGTLQFGVCRHRALLMKYLCDRMEPQIPCELVRGYLDFMPHAWNVVLIKRGNTLIRMVVDACRPHDIREETDPEYFCRYIPLGRINVSLPTQTNPAPCSSFPSLSTCDKIGKSASSSLICCKFGSVEAAAKVRTLEVFGTSVDEIKNFEYRCLGEVRILGALKHSCIVEIYGHQISSKWVPSCDGNPDRRILQSAILLEHIKGGSLKKYVDKLSKAGEKHVPVELALFIARDVAWALAELHSKHIIHRDIKSENVLIDLNRKKPDGSPIVKLCDFDRAVPLRSFLHTCSIAHTGIHPPDACVGTPHWMAPEVLNTMHERKIYGLEVDIWSYGCLLYELLTLQVPYSGLPESNIHDILQMGERPRLTEELEALGSSDEPSMAGPGTVLDAPEADFETLRFLIDIFRKCTQRNPTDRPTADSLYKSLVEQLSTCTSSESFKKLET